MTAIAGYQWNVSIRARDGDPKGWRTLANFATEEPALDFAQRIVNERDNGEGELVDVKVSSRAVGAWQRIHEFPAETAASSGSIAPS
jgi:hypothetical protein